MISEYDVKQWVVINSGVTSINKGRTWAGIVAIPGVQPAVKHSGITIEKCYCSITEEIFYDPILRKALELHLNKTNSKR